MKEACVLESVEPCWCVLVDFWLCYGTDQVLDKHYEVKLFVTVTPFRKSAGVFTYVTRLQTGTGDLVISKFPIFFCHLYYW